MADADAGDVPSAVAERVSDAVARVWRHGYVTELATLSGGHSGLTLSAQLHFSPTAAPEPIVIKAAPPGRTGVGRHDVGRQARLYRALHAADGVKVPAVVFEDLRDPPLFAMQRLEGDALEPVLEPAVAGALGDACVESRALASADMLAALHRIDPLEADLGPHTTIGQEVERWSATMRAVPTEIRGRGLELAEALASSAPADQAPAVVHGDYRLGNILASGHQLRGIIDWEIWIVADPRLELGWYLAHFDDRNYPGIARPVPGLPAPAAVLDRYVEAVGHAVDDFPWFDAFGRFKLAAIMGHNLRRHREGRRIDPFQELLPDTIERFIRTGLELVR